VRGNIKSFEKPFTHAEVVALAERTLKRFGGDRNKAGRYARSMENRYESSKWQQVVEVIATSGRQHHATKKMTKAERLSIIKAARQASHEGERQLAAVLFAMIGISYADGQPTDDSPVLHATKKKLEWSIPSVGHLAWLDGRTKEAYVHGGEVYIAPTSYPLDTEGRRQGARWESSLPHWKRYYDTLWRARVVGGSRKRREYWIAPASDPRDRYAAGRDANSFTSRREAQVAIRSLRRLGGDMDVPWIINED
jgi:hypothetical protein